MLQKLFEKSSAQREGIFTANITLKNLLTGAREVAHST